MIILISIVGPALIGWPWEFTGNETDERHRL